MSINEHYSHPKGVAGRILLTAMNIAHTPMAIWALKQIDFPAGAKVLDIGCGGGINIKRMLKRCPDGKVYGLDISGESVRRSRQLNRKDLGTRCRILRGSAEAIPSKDRAFTIVTAFETVYFWKDIETCFREIRRVLRPAGRFFVCNDSADPDLGWEEKIPNMKILSPEEIRDLMSGAGFDPVTVRRNGRRFCVCGTVPG